MITEHINELNEAARVSALIYGQYIGFCAVKSGSSPEIQVYPSALVKIAPVSEWRFTKMYGDGFYATVDVDGVEWGAVVCNIARPLD